MALCFDTDFLIDYLAQRPEAEALLESVPGPVLLSTLSVYELLCSAKGRRITQVDDLVRDYAVVPADFAVSSLAAEIQRDLATRGELIPHFDALIAATAILTGAELVTSDPHYERIPARFGLVLHSYHRG
jgi:predicted nucleic acid-binding protein